MTEAIKPGDYVKALRDGQRMWFQVMKVGDGGVLTTMLDSEPITELEGRRLPTQPTLRRNDIVLLHTNEVMEVDRV